MSVVDGGGGAGTEVVEGVRALDALVVVEGEGIGLIEVEVVWARFVDRAVVDAIDEAVVVGVSGEVRKLFAVVVFDVLFSALSRR